MKTVAVIGAGAAGRAFALRCAGAGFAVVLEDVMPSNLRRAQDEYGELAGVEAAGSLRVALTGSLVSPGIDATLAALGREEALARIGAASV